MIVGCETSKINFY